MYGYRSQIIGADAKFESPFGKRLVTYADHTASGRCLRYIEDFIINNVLPSYGNTHTSDSYIGHTTTKMVHEAADYIKGCMGCSAEVALLFCGSGSTASIKRLQEVMGLTVPSILRDRVLRFLPKEERWVVFVGPYEHHSNLLSWRQSLAEVVEVGLDSKGSVNMEELRRKLKCYKDMNRPLLRSFSACSNVTGIYTDTRTIAVLLHQYGAFACFDFAARRVPFRLCRNMEILGSKTADRQAIFSFLIYSTTNSISSSSIVNGRDGYGGRAAEAADGLYIWREVGDRRDRPLHGAFVATILNDLFGIQSRGGCACAGPYGHALLGISESQSLAIRSAIEKIINK
ncbi:hypothetical protein SAY86_031573 [Trapa natans]|uniref:Aminotransferase class V domain-containing protein n=1 Tax=Trapa natans TaxID=22666 RepID=A0AAN7LRZ2_TRANT|nr:hypothetical protein SAY86_031573 [Trapa natans]